ncbi:uncharacterized protein LOC143202660 [Rhynchophorus ferrugineus]|uniref:uncharacterized protein LOC143202660 n=1 Tax=Rhynchophorus ferrugineus TaxID=354439 RepID=UPI003FCC3537
MVPIPFQKVPEYDLNALFKGFIIEKKWSQGLLFHQGAVDCARAALLLPLGTSILHCQPVHKCSLVETAFLLLVTVATVNMLTTVLNDSPVFPDDEDGDTTITEAPLLMDSPQCVLFGTFMIWFASITINLGPTFLSGALAAQGEAGHKHPSCPLIYGPLRHYILNALWIAVNLVCVFLTLFHLRKLHRDLTKANVEAVRVTGLVTTLVNITGGSNQMNCNNERWCFDTENKKRSEQTKKFKNGDLKALFNETINGVRHQLHLMSLCRVLREKRPGYEQRDDNVTDKGENILGNINTGSAIQPTVFSRPCSF